MKQTAVDWLACEIGGLDTGVSYHYFAKKVEEAKEMEKQQTMQFAVDWYNQWNKENPKSIINYYNETYGGKNETL